MVTICSNNVVVWVDRSLYGSRRYGLLAVVEVAESHDLAKSIELGTFLLKTTDKEHIVIPAQECGAGQAHQNG